MAKGNSGSNKTTSETLKGISSPDQQPVFQKPQVQNFAIPGKQTAGDVLAHIPGKQNADAHIDNAPADKFNPDDAVAPVFVAPQSTLDAVANTLASKPDVLAYIPGKQNADAPSSAPGKVEPTKLSPAPFPGKQNALDIGPAIECSVNLGQQFTQACSGQDLTPRIPPNFKPVVAGPAPGN